MYVYITNITMKNTIEYKAIFPVYSCVRVKYSRKFFNIAVKAFAFTELSEEVIKREGEELKKFN